MPRDDDNVSQAAPTITSAFSSAVHDSGVQIGGLLLLQASSYCVGGIIERGGSSLDMLQFFDSRIIAMLCLMLCLMLAMVLIGMVMDPFGALFWLPAHLRR